MEVSIIMLTYNAPIYASHSIKSIYRNTIETEYELIVYDNASLNRTKKMLSKFEKKGMIDKLVFSDVNHFFVGGNNRAVIHASEDSKYILLLNSDIEIRNKKWLTELIKIHKRGITACQVCSEKDYRPDGWCLLVDKDIYNQFKLDEKRFTWYFSIADFASRVMKAGYKVQSIRNYENVIKHFGGASEIETEVAMRSLKDGMDIETWFPNKCDVINQLEVSTNFNVISFFGMINFILKIQKKIKRYIKK